MTARDFISGATNVHGLDGLVLWQVRGYIKAVAAGQVPPLRDMRPRRVDHQRVFIAVRDHIRQLLPDEAPQQQVYVFQDDAAAAEC